jgi:uncharacterized membrane protein
MMDQPITDQQTGDQPDKSDALPVTCPECAARMPGAAAFCPGCGRTMSAPPLRAQGRVGFLPERIAGALAYFTFVPAAVFLMVDPYRGNRFVRFHSVQCLLLWVVGLAGAAALKLAGLLLFLIPLVGPLFAVLVSMVAGLAAFAVWLVLVVKALQGEMFKLPVLGDFAEQHADVPPESDPRG